jgi:subtilisin family serine protease
VDNEKIENLLNISLNATVEERQTSQILAQGYHPDTKVWEVVVRYVRTLEPVREISAQIRIVELLGQYAILWLPESLIEQVAKLDNILYMEMPKSFYFSVNQGKEASCVSFIQSVDTYGLTGKGVLIGIADSGIDVSHLDFRNPDGSSRIRYLWDQSGNGGTPPQGYGIGREYTQENLDALLSDTTDRASLEEVRRLETSGHGTAVAGIAAGNGRESDGVYSGMAPESKLVIVKLAPAAENGFPRTTQIMMAVDYLIRKSLELGQPMAINLSFGNNYGAHSGQSLLETYLDTVSDIAQLSICVGSGNEGNSAIHTSIRVKNSEDYFNRNPLYYIGNQAIYEIPISVGTYQTSFSIQIWKYYTDVCRLTLVHPSGQQVILQEAVSSTQRYSLQNTSILFYGGTPQPYQIWQELFLDLLPEESYVDSGIWKIRLEPLRTVRGEYDFWLPTATGLNSSTAFQYPTPDKTLTIPSTASKVITVGAYNSRTLSYAPFSGRGFTNFTNQAKPDLVAPGVEVMSTKVGGGYEQVTGTSFATPFVTGAAALLMQWGIVQGNDLFLYGQKLKAFLHRGAKELRGFEEYPNAMVGWGENVIIRSHGRKSVKSSVSVHFPNTETKHFFHNFEENLPGLDAK